MLVVPALAGLAFLVLPLAGLLVRAPWGTLLERLAEPQVLEALRLSLVCATIATALCLVFGVPLAWLLARVDFPGVTLPLIAPGVVAGAVLCWARALGEFGATITFAGNFPGTTRTMPLAVYLALETEPEAAIVLSLVLLAVSVIILASLRDRWVSSP
ncbi:hypothetical protein [Nonomuraea jabiensis]|uniref:hypothetical protein n=1 Tax=Nonomuraea jabiensis TaxID=882448 RepID=UPI00369C93A2